MAKQHFSSLQEHLKHVVREFEKQPPGCMAGVVLHFRTNHWGTCKFNKQWVLKHCPRPTFPFKVDVDIQSLLRSLAETLQVFPMMTFFVVTPQLIAGIPTLVPSFLCYPQKESYQLQEAQRKVGCKDIPLIAIDRYSDPQGYHRKEYEYTEAQKAIMEQAVWFRSQMGRRHNVLSLNVPQEDLERYFRLYSPYAADLPHASSLVWRQAIRYAVS